MDTQKLENTSHLILSLAISYGPKLFVAFAFLAAGFVAGRWAGRVFEGWLSKRELEPPVRILLVRVVRLVVLALFLLMAVQNLGIELLPLIAGLGIAGVGVSLALQGVLQNLTAGLTIIFTKPFRVGEYIRLLGVHGEVIAVEMFTTTLQQPDMARIVIPNKKIIGEILHNHGKIRQLDLRVGVAYTTNVGKVLAAVGEVLRANALVLKDPAPAVGIAQLTDSSIVVAVAPWVKVTDFTVAGSDIYAALLERFGSEGVELPGPHPRVRLVEPA